MSSGVLYTLSTVCQCLILYSLFFRLNVSTGFFFILSSASPYLTLHRSLFLCQCIHCCLIESVQCLSVPHIVPSVCSVSLRPLVSCRVCPLSVRTSHSTVCCFRVTASTGVFYILSTVCQYLTIYLCLFLVTSSTVVFFCLSTVSQFLTLYLLLFLCYSFHCFLVQSLLCCHYLTLYRLLDLCNCVHWCLLQSVHCLSLPHTVPSVGSMSLRLLVSFTASPLSVCTSHCTVSLFCVTASTGVFYRLSTLCLYLTLYRLFVLCQCVHF